MFSPVINSENITAGRSVEKEESPEVATPGSQIIDTAPAVSADTETTTERVPAGTTSTRWRRWNGRERVEVFADWFAGYLVGPAGTVRFTGRRSVAGLLRELPADVDRVFLTGPIPGGTPDGFRSWGSPPKMPAGWAPAAAGHFVERPENPVLKFERRLPDGLRRVEIHRAAAWFGEGEYTPDQALRARCELRRLLSTRFPTAPGLLATPATTGVELWRSLIPYGVEWPVLPADVREEIRATMGQGRFQFFAPAAGVVLPEIAVFDARFQYASLCRELPAGVPVRKLRPEFEPYARARWKFTATVPPGWPFPGVLGHQGAAGAWEFPAEPGETFTAWADGAELILAERFGWRVEIHEGIVWPEREHDPLRAWAERLAALRAGGGAELAGDIAPLVAAALRALLLFGIGRFGAGSRLVTKSAPLHEPGAVPATARRPRVEGDRIVWAEPVEPDPSLSHPEWAATIYGRARARLLHSPTGTRGVYAGALHAPPGAVLRFALDSLTLTVAPEWPDDGRNGRLRLKSYVPGPIPAPASETALVALQRAHEPAPRTGAGTTEATGTTRQDAGTARAAANA